MYLGRVRNGDWVTVLHSKQSNRTKVILYSSGQHGNATLKIELEMPEEDIPDWSGTHRKTTYDKDGFSTVDPPASPYQPYVQGYQNPTVSLLDKDRTVIVDAKKMHLLDSRISPSLFVSEIFIGSDVPEGYCILRTEYVSEHVSWKWSEQSVYPPGIHDDFPSGGTAWTEGRVMSTQSFGTYADIHHLEVTPSGSGTGTYMSSYVYDHPHASFLLGQYDSEALDFRKNPRT